MRLLSTTSPEKETATNGWTPRRPMKMTKRFCTAYARQFQGQRHRHDDGAQHQAEDTEDLNLSLIHI